MIVTLDSKRRLRVPVEVMPTEPGEHFQMDFDPDEDMLMCHRISPGTDWLEVLKQCPVPLDDLPPRRLTYFRSKL